MVGNNTLLRQSVSLMTSYVQYFFVELVVNTIRIAVLASIIVGLLTTPLRANEKNMSISVDPINLVSGSIPITFNMKLAEHFSLGISAYDKVFSLDKTKSKIMGVGGGLGFKFHLSAPAFQNGWFVKPEIMAGYWQIGEDPNKTKGFSIEPRAMAGYEWVWPGGFYLSLGIGIKYCFLTGNLKSIQEFPNLGFHEFFPNADLSVGWAF